MLTAHAAGKGRGGGGEARNPGWFSAEGEENHSAREPERCACDASAFVILGSFSLEKSPSPRRPSFVSPVAPESARLRVREERRRRGEPALSPEKPGCGPTRRCRSKAESGFLVGYFSNTPPLLLPLHRPHCANHSCTAACVTLKIKNAHRLASSFAVRGESCRKYTL